MSYYRGSNYPPAPPPGGYDYEYGAAGGGGRPPPPAAGEGGGGGYGPPPPGYGHGPPPPAGGRRAPPVSYGTGPPPGADPQLWSWFQSVDRDRSGSINAAELQSALVNGDWTPFDLDTVKLLMTIFDVDHSGTITFNEFGGLWRYVQDWQGVFRHFDRDRSGGIDERELTDALRSFGYHLPHRVIATISRKYGKPSDLQGSINSNPALPGSITFDRFVRACVVVKTLTENFQRLDKDRDGWVQINYDTFMELALSAP